MIPDKDYELLSSVESHGGSGSYGVKILVYRPQDALKRFRDVSELDYDVKTDEQRKVMLMVPDAPELLVAIRKQDRLLDPAVKEAANETKMYIMKAFHDAGFPPIFVEEVPNGYWPDWDPWSVGAPWYQVTTMLGRFTVGWRKRVINLGWNGTMLRSRTKGHLLLVPSGEEVFPKEDSTRWDCGIHAYGYGKLTEYLTVLKQWALYSTQE